MKYLDGKEVLRGDSVIVPIEETVAVGQVHQFMERTGHVRISGYALPVLANTAVLAKVAYDAYAGPMLAKQKADTEAALKSNETNRPDLNDDQKAAISRAEQIRLEQVEVARVNAEKAAETDRLERAAHALNLTDEEKLAADRARKVREDEAKLLALENAKALPAEQPPTPLTAAEEAAKMNADREAKFRGEQAEALRAAGYKDTGLSTGQVGEQAAALEAQRLARPNVDVG